MEHIKGIYGITYKNKVVYVGQSVNINLRIKQHLRTLDKKRHHNFILQRMYNKGGYLFDFKVLEEIEDYFLLTSREQFWIEKFDTINIAKANGSYCHTEESKLKMSNYAKNRTIEHREKLKQALKGKIGSNLGKVGLFKHTDEAKLKIGKASKGNKHNLGFKHSHATKQKLSQIRKNIINTKLVLNIVTGIYYNSLKEACIIHNLKYTLTSDRLRGRTRNNTNLIYV